MTTAATVSLGGDLTARRKLPLRRASNVPTPSRSIGDLKQFTNIANYISRGAEGGTSAISVLSVAKSFFIVVPAWPG